MTFHFCRYLLPGDKKSRFEAEYIDLKYNNNYYYYYLTAIGFSPGDKNEVLCSQ